MRKPSFPQRLPDAATPGRLCPPSLLAQTPIVGADAILLRRSLLHYWPSAPPYARAYGLPLRSGAAQMNR
jgi:hypothetical protein